MAVDVTKHCVLTTEGQHKEIAQGLHKPMFGEKELAGTKQVS